MRFPTTPNGEIDEERAQAMLDEAIGAIRGITVLSSVIPLLAHLLLSKASGSYTAAPKALLCAIRGITVLSSVIPLLAHLLLSKAY